MALADLRRIAIIARVSGLQVPATEKAEPVVLRMPTRTWHSFIAGTSVAGAVAGAIFQNSLFHGFRFALCFAFIATVAGVFWAARIHTSESGRIWRLLTFAAFPLTGAAFSYLLGARYETEYRVSTISFYAIMVPLAVGLFTFMFCSMISGMMEHIKNVIPFSVVVAVPLISAIVLAPHGAQERHVMTELALYLVCYCCGLLGLLLLLSFFMADSFSNLLPNVLLLIALNVTLPLAFPAGGEALVLVVIAHLIAANVLFGLQLFAAFRRRKAPPTVFVPRFDSTLGRALFVAPVLANMSVFATIGSIIPYFGIILHLQRRNLFSKQSVMIGSCLGMASTFVYAASYLFYDLAFPAIYDRDFSGAVALKHTMFNIVFLTVIAWFSSSVLAWCFAYHEKHFAPGVDSSVQSPS